MNEAFWAWDEVFSYVTITSAIFDRILHHCQVISIKGESYLLKERKELMKEIQKRINTLFSQTENRHQWCWQYGTWRSKFKERY
ncbi:ATP-binding protein [Lachnospiraceae bacterium C1.1]|nr:ATP-binding protein [Lachnospiraceae bacterium C1.1]